MKTLFYTLLIFFALGCSKKPPWAQPQNYAVKNAKSYNMSGAIYLFGDGLAHGVGASSEENSLIGCLRKHSSRQVFDRGLVGATSKDGRQQVDAIAEEKPALVIISLGLNDVYTKDISSLGTYINLTRVYDQLTKAGSLVLQIGIDPPQSLDKNVKFTRLPRIKAVAQKAGAIYLDKSLQGLWGHKKSMSSPIFPNDEGYQQLCQRVIQALEPYFIFDSDL